MKIRTLATAVVMSALAPIAVSATASASTTVGSEVADGYVGNNITLLGAPDGDEAAFDGGGFGQSFEHGWLVQAPGSTTAYAVVGPMSDTYLNAKSTFGFPTSNPTTIKGGYAQTFTSGAITSKSLSSGSAYGSTDVYNTLFRNAGGMKGQLGVATGTPSVFNGHNVQWFTSGQIDATKNLYVLGGIGDYYRNGAGVSNQLKAPTGSEQAISGGWYQDFEGGRLYYQNSTTKAVVRGGILTKFVAGGGPSAFGWPTAAEVTDPTYGPYQKTTKGTFWYNTGSLTKPAAKGTSSTPSSSVVTRYTNVEANVRSAASLSSSVITVLPNNTKVTGTISGSFLKVATPSAYAGRYISTSVLTSTAPSAPAPASNAWKPASQYAQPVKGAITSGTGSNLTSGMNGVKVWLVQEALGIAHTPMNSTMGPTTTAKVKEFQSKHGLVADGVVGPATWAKLNTGYSFNIDAWKQGSNVSTTASRTERVNAMVSYIRAQMNKPYIWGGTGPFGFDCSGLMIQGMRAGGVDPKNVSNYTNERPASDLSNQMWLDSEFQKGSLSNLQFGDMIFYGTASGHVGHVSIYIGNGQVINAVGSKVQISSSSELFGWNKQVGVKRAFAL